jgi:hypothetical protein
MINSPVQQEWNVPKQHNLNWYLELEHRLRQKAGRTMIVIYRKQTVESDSGDFLCRKIDGNTAVFRIPGCQ